MDHLKALVEAAGSNMECLLKVVVWLKDQVIRNPSTASTAATSEARRRDQQEPHAGRPHTDGLPLEIHAIAMSPTSESVRWASAAARIAGRATAARRWWRRKDLGRQPPLAQLIDEGDNLGSIAGPPRSVPRRADRPRCRADRRPCACALTSSILSLACALK